VEGKKQQSLKKREALLSGVMGKKGKKFLKKPASKGKKKERKKERKENLSKERGKSTFWGSRRGEHGEDGEHFFGKREKKSS